MTTAVPKSFKPEPVLLSQTHNFFEAPLPVKHSGYADNLIHNTSSNRRQTLELKEILYFMIPKEIA